MTDHREDDHREGDHTDDMAHLDDDAVSAVVDGDAAPAVLAHAESCPRCGARVDAVRRVVGLVAAPVPPPDSERTEAAITAAVAHMGADDDAPDQVLAPVRRLRGRPPAWLLPAAATVAGLALVGALLAQVDGRDDSGGGDDRAAASAEDDSGGGAADLGGAGEAPSTLAETATRDLGDLGDLDAGSDLRSAVSRAEDRADDRAEAAEGNTSDAPALACEAPLREADASLGELRVVGRARWEDDDAYVLVFATDDDTALRVYVVDAGTCEIRTAASIRP